MPIQTAVNGEQTYTVELDDRIHELSFAVNAVPPTTTISHDSGVYPTKPLTILGMFLDTLLGQCGITTQTIDALEQRWNPVRTMHRLGPSSCLHLPEIEFARFVSFERWSHVYEFILRLRGLPMFKHNTGRYGVGMRIMDIYTSKHDGYPIFPVFTHGIERPSCRSR